MEEQTQHRRAEKARNSIFLWEEGTVCGAETHKPSCQSCRNPKGWGGDLKPNVLRTFDSLLPTQTSSSSMFFSFVGAS